MTSLSCSWSWQKCFVFRQGECCLLVVYLRWPLCWGRFPLCPLSAVFVYQFCQKLFLHLLEMIIWFSFFSLLIWCVTLVELHILKNPCIPGINLTWSWCINLLMCCQIRFGSTLLRIFVSKMCHILKHLVKSESFQSWCYRYLVLNDREPCRRKENQLYVLIFP